MSTGHTDRKQKKSVRTLLRSITNFVSWAAPAALIAGAFYFAAYEPAHSQIESRKHPAPFSSSASSALESEAPKLPRAPAQIEMPAPAPMKIFAGLEEPLVATGPVTDQENQDIDAALAAFREAPANAGPQGDYLDWGKPLIAFIEAHPNSNWNAALYTNIGLGYYHSGYYSKAFPAFEQAWKLGREAKGPQIQLLIDRAVAELARMHARVGHEKEMEAVLADIGERRMGGNAVDIVQGVHEILYGIRNNVGYAYLCGPMALKNVLLALDATPEQIKVAEDARSGPHGFSLEQLAQLADNAQLKYSLIKREAGQPIPVPSIVHWNVNHYAALTEMRDSNYVMQDPTFNNGGLTVLTARAIDSEASGYFLVPDSVVKANPTAGWQKIAKDSAEAKAVYGMGGISGVANRFNCPGTSQATKNTGANSGNGEQMCVSTTHPSSTSLSLTDSPVGYQPQKGKTTAYTAIFYNQRDDQQPSNFSFSNLSVRWAHTWQLYIEDDPLHPGQNVIRTSSGGGAIPYNRIYYTANGKFTPDVADISVLQRIPASGAATSYTRTMPDGGQETYSTFDGATTYPRRVFLTQIVDQAGNTTTLHYDALMRITSVTDQTGRDTTFSYGLGNLLITQITDPFGRATQITYDGNGRLSSITDPVGITSSFAYNDTNDGAFVTDLTTPYGHSVFSGVKNPNDPSQSSYATRSLTITDPMGYTEYYYSYPDLTIVPAYAPTGTVPSVCGVGDGLLQVRNTYYWDKHAFAQGATMSGGVVQSQDFSKSTILHWAHDIYNSALQGSLLESYKKPLENRLWMCYSNNPYSFAVPTVVNHVMEGGATTAKTFSVYGGTGVPFRIKYPTSPYAQYNYAANNIDVTNVTYYGVGTIAQYGSYTTTHHPQTYTDVTGKVWNYTWNAAGQLTSTTDPDSYTTTNNYDSLGRLTSVVNANNVTALTLTYDSADRIRTRTDSQGYVLTYDYDNIDRLTKVTYPDGTTDLFDYNFQAGPFSGTPSLDLRKTTDRLGRVTIKDYDANRRLISTTEPVAGATTRTTTFDYYETDVIKNMTDAKGNVTHWEIDLESRPISKTYAYGTPQAKTETYVYSSADSLLKSVTDALGQTKTYSYNVEDRVTSISYANTVNPTPNVTFTYNFTSPLMSSPQMLSSMTDGTGTTTFSYGSQNTTSATKLTSVNGPNANDTISFTYDNEGRISTETITGGNETFTYDPLSRLSTHATPLGTFNYGYLGQTGLQTSQSVTNGGTTVSTSFGYDTNVNDMRLISIVNSGTSRSYTLGYTSGGSTNPYDILSIVDTAAAGHPFATQTHGYTYDDADRMLTAAQTTPGNYTYGYDKLDNATTVTTPSGTVTPAPTYNNKNQLSTWTANTYSYDDNGNTLSGDGTKTYKYDAENRLIEIDYVGTSNKTVFAYNALGQRVASAETVGGVTTTTRYLWCGEQICQSRDGSDNVLKRYVPEGEYTLSTAKKLIYMLDQLGSVRDVLDASIGVRTASYDYGPYGAVTQSSVTSGTDYQYAGLLYHPASGLYLSQTRAFDPVSGRFLNRDPIGETGGINLYAYTRASPINRADPNGQNPLALAAIAVALQLINNGGQFGCIDWADVAAFAFAPKILEMAVGLRGLVLGTRGSVAVRGALEADRALIAAERAGKAVTAAVLAAKGAETTVTVGRWMSQVELKAMQATGRVQESYNAGVTSVSLPANSAAYGAAPAGDVFVQFDVPRSAIGAADGIWAKIFGPNSIFGPAKGITEMPPATNIEVGR